MNIRDVKRKYKLPLIIVGAFLLAAVWVGAGRILFGVFGWMAFITLFGFAPIILLYGVVLAAVVAVRQQSYIFRAKGPFRTWLSVTLGGLFILGLSMPDAGDTRDSGGSALSVLLGDKTDGGLIGLSGTLVMLSLLTIVVAAIVTFILVFFERAPRGEKPSRPPAS